MRLVYNGPLQRGRAAPLILRGAARSGEGARLDGPSSSTRKSKTVRTRLLVCTSRWDTSHAGTGMGAIVHKPPCLTDHEAAAVPFGANCALAFLRGFTDVRPGQRLLVVGASGGVGVWAVQLARHFGAEVTGVCSARNVDLAQAVLTWWSAGRKVKFGISRNTRAGLEVIVDFIESGALKPVVDRVYPMREIADAHRHVEGRHKRGSVVVAVGA
jgi:NADPH:quinone reductase-like Zn-dependent oxidoreductase